jgi:hypothetical protein
MRAASDDAEVAKQRFPAFRFLFLFRSFFVIAGLDPAIHAAKKLASSTGRLSTLQTSMDRQIKPAVTKSVRRCLTSLTANSDA